MTSKIMNRKLLIACLALPIGLVSLMPKAALADDHHNESNHQPTSVQNAQPQGNRTYGNQGQNVQPQGNRTYGNQGQNARPQDNRTYGNQVYQGNQVQTNRRDVELREEARQQEIRQQEIRQQQERQAQLQRNDSRWNNSQRNDHRVWVPGHNESGFLGLFSHWVDGHWEVAN